MHKAALELFDLALEGLIEHRSREGAELQQLIINRLDSVSAQVVNVRARMPEILAAQREKLQAKLAALQVDLEPERLEQEIVLLAQKADVDEELDRLDTHVIEVKRSLNPKLERGFHAACEDLQPQRKLLVYPGNEVYPMAHSVQAMPLKSLCAELSAIAPQA